MNIQNMFKRFRQSYESFKSKDSLGKAKYLSRLVKMVSLENPHYHLGKYELIKLVKKKFHLLIDDLGFECRRCEESCCFFDLSEVFLMDIGLYKEDIEVLKENNVDMKGILFKPSKLQYKVVSQVLNLDISYELFSEIKRDVERTVGYEGDLRMEMDKKEGRVRCYYYDVKEKRCKIHQYKPLVCETFPIRVQNNEKRVGILFCEDCKFIEEKCGELGVEGFNEKMMSYYSYWEYILAIMLFFWAKKRVFYHKGLLDSGEKKIEKDCKMIYEKYKRKLKEERGK
jgi:Fe-S-cluster containining protein